MFEAGHTVYIEGAYTLEQELRTLGVVPAFDGEHVCSMKSKAAPLDTWRAHEFEEAGYRHICGYSAGEQGRISSSNGAIIKRNNKALREGETTAAGSSTVTRYLKAGVTKGQI